MGKTNNFREKYGNGNCSEERAKELDNQRNHCTNEADNLTQNWWAAAQFLSCLLLSSIIYIKFTFLLEIYSDFWFFGHWR